MSLIRNVAVIGSFRQHYREVQTAWTMFTGIVARHRRATLDISEGWVTRLHDKDSIAPVFGSYGITVTESLENNWRKIPEQLGSLAFIPEHVMPLLQGVPNETPIRNRVNTVITEDYFKSYTLELGAGLVTDLVYLATGLGLDSHGPDLPYLSLLQELNKAGLSERVDQTSPDKLLALKDDPVWVSCLAAATVTFAQKLSNPWVYAMATGLRELESATIGIITALPEEFAAVCEVLRCHEVNVPGKGAGRKYAFGRLAILGYEHRIAVAMTVETGNNSAGIRASQLKGDCPLVHHIIMTGIAGAVPHPSKAEDHVRLGDIVVSDRNGVIQYDLGKESATGMEHRHPPRPPSAALLEAVKFLQVGQKRGRYPWIETIEEYERRLGAEWKRPSEDHDVLQDDPAGPVTQPPLDLKRKAGNPRVFFGPIASAGIVLKDPRKRDYLRDRFGVKAVEMEASGIADATWQLELGGYLVIRGTCDYCNWMKNDIWHNYAALIAASYTKSVIERLAPA